MSAERLLLEAVVEALTLPDDVPGHGRRIAARALIARVVVRDALDGNPADLAWNADWLRQQMREEEARHPGAEPAS